MFDVFLDVWDWLVAGFCDPKSTVERNHRSASSSSPSSAIWSSTSSNHRSSDPNSAFPYDTDDDYDDDDSTQLRAAASYDNYTPHDDDADDAQGAGANANNTIESVWRVATRTQQLKLVKLDVDATHVDYLMEQSKQWKTMTTTTHQQHPQGLSEICLLWCHLGLTDGTADALVDFVECHADTLTTLKIWKTQESGTAPMELVLQLLQHSWPNKLHGLQCLELSYFDLGRQYRSLWQALCNALARPNHLLQHLNLSFCQLGGVDAIQQLTVALQQRHTSSSNRRRSSFLTVNDNSAFDRLERLSLNGTGLSDAMLKRLVHGLTAKGESSSSSPLPHLSTLSLGYNKLTAASLPTLSTLLATTSTLHTLHVPHNPQLWVQPTEAQSKALCAALSLPDSGLYTLNLAHCGIRSQNILPALFAAIRQANVLHNLNLSSPKDDHALQLDDAWLIPMSQCQSLQHLTLSRHLATSHSRQWKALEQRLLANNCTLLELRLVDDDEASIHGSRRRQLERSEETTTDILVDPTTSAKNDDSALSPTLRAWLSRNQMLCLACTTVDTMPMSLWPRVIQTLFKEERNGGRRRRSFGRRQSSSSKTSSHTATSVYGFLQTCLGGGGENA